MKAKTIEKVNAFFEKRGTEFRLVTNERDDVDLQQSAERWAAKVWPPDEGDCGPAITVLLSYPGKESLRYVSSSGDTVVHVTFNRVEFYNFGDAEHGKALRSEILKTFTEEDEYKMQAYVDRIGPAVFVAK